MNKLDQISERIGLCLVSYFDEQLPQEYKELVQVCSVMRDGVVIRANKAHALLVGGPRDAEIVPTDIRNPTLRISVNVSTKVNGSYGSCGVSISLYEEHCYEYSPFCYQFRTTEPSPYWSTSIGRVITGQVNFMTYLHESIVHEEEDVKLSLFSSAVFELLEIF
jgi:hypothetical protein